MEEDKRPSVFIATPMYGGMCTGDFTMGLLKTMAQNQQLKIKTYFSFLVNESLITRGRNELARQFLESDADYLMFIDADIGYPHNAVAALILADKDIVCAPYPKKEINWDGVRKAAKEDKADLADYSASFVFNTVTNQQGYVETDEDGIIEVRHGGTGFMLIKRRVFENLKQYVPTYRRSTERDPKTGEYIHPLTYEFFATSIDGTGALLSEDYHFCALWKKYGGQIHMHPAIPLSHMGSYRFEGDLIKSGGQAK